VFSLLQRPPHDFASAAFGQRVYKLHHAWVLVGGHVVFAPTDEAFANLPTGTVEGLLKDIPKLKSILTYHVLEGKMLSEDLANLTSAKTIQGQDIDIDTKDGVKINKAKVTNPNILASNGVIHIIDTVILPK
jgi:uncharacterized surface protein with fasciclin (FAS1) repeats